MGCIEEAFESLMAKTGTTPEDAVKVVADVVDDVFRWTANNEINPKFSEWRRWFWDSDFTMPQDYKPSKLECQDTRDPMACSFRDQFDKLLERLRYQALINTPTLQPTESGSRLPDPEPYDESGTRQDREVKRAKLVGQVRQELQDFRQQLTDCKDDKEIKELASQHRESASSRKKVISYFF